MIVLLVILAVVAVLIVGGLLIGLAFKLLWWALIGLVIGGLARLVLPGRQEIGLLATAAAGVAGSILGGIIGHALDLGGLLQFVIAIAVAAGLVAVLGGSRAAAT